MRRNESKVIGGPPLISVLMAMRNSAAFLEEAIGSVLAQTTRYTWELVIVDDGSTDTSLSIAMQLARKHPDRLRVLRHPGGVNRGISASRNLALQHARGAVVAFLDADDVFLEHHLQTQMAVLEQHPSVSMVYGTAERWCDPSLPYHRAQSESAWWGQNYTPPIAPAGEAGGLLQPGTLLRWFLQDESLVPCICTVLVRRKTALALGGFEAPFRGLYDDQVFHAKLSLQFPIYANAQCVARYRQHTHSCCAAGRADAHKQQEASRAFRDWLRHYTARAATPLRAQPRPGPCAAPEQASPEPVPA